MERDNATWLNDLQSDGSRQSAALSDLGEQLRRRLRHALSDRNGVDSAFIDDMVQESLLRILERLDQFAGRSRFLTWATSIAIHGAIDELRHRRWRDVSLDGLIADAGDSAEQVLTDTAANGSESERRVIVAALHAQIRAGLTERQRTALLAELKGMPQEEIAQRLGTNRNAIYKLTHDARKRLKRGLEAAGYQATDIRAAFA